MKKEWDKIYSSKIKRHKNEWPNEELIGFVNRTYSFKKNKSKIKILELGCGWGNNLKLFKKNNYDYYGVEQSIYAFNFLKKNFKNVFCYNFSNLNFQNNYFDCVVDRQSMQHNNLEEILKTISEVNRVLKRGGLFYSHLISVNNYKETTTSLKKRQILKLFEKFQIESFQEIIKKEKNNNKESLSHKCFIIIGKKQ